MSNTRKTRIVLCAAALWLAGCGRLSPPAPSPRSDAGERAFSHLRQRPPGKPPEETTVPDPSVPPRLYPEAAPDPDVFRPQPDVAATSDFVRRMGYPPNTELFTAAFRVTLLYFQILGREPDAGGLQGFVQFLLRGGRTDLAYFLEPAARQAMANSPESLTRIQRVYRALLGRNAASPEALAWAHFLANGGRVAEMPGHFAASAEAAAIITNLYLHYLDRRPDERELLEARSELRLRGLFSLETRLREEAP